jgi:type IV fimbrial biogenesis protein FimT
VSKSPAKSAHKYRGFTLLELMYGIGIATVVLGMAVPAMQQTLRNARRTAAINALVAGIEFARSEALKTGATVVLCQSEDRSTCSHSPSFATGWIAFANTEADNPPQRDDGEPLLRVHAQRFVGSVSANRTAFEIRPYPKRSTNGTITFCDGTAYAHRLIVSYTGRPRSERVPLADASC